MPTPGAKYRGWHYDPANDRLDLYYNGTRIAHLTNDGDCSTIGLHLVSGSSLVIPSGATVCLCGNLTSDGCSTVTLQGPIIAPCLPSSAGCLPAGSLYTVCTSCVLHVAVVAGC